MYVSGHDERYKVERDMNMRRQEGKVYESWSYKIRTRDFLHR